jgi:cytochrome c553
MNQPQLTETAKTNQKHVIQSIINRATDEDIKTAATHLQQLMIAKGMDTPKPKVPLTPEQKAYLAGRKSGAIQRIYPKQIRHDKGKTN